MAHRAKRNQAHLAAPPRPVPVGERLQTPAAGEGQRADALHPVALAHQVEEMLGGQNLIAAGEDATERDNFHRRLQHPAQVGQGPE